MPAAGRPASGSGQAIAGSADGQLRLARIVAEIKAALLLGTWWYVVDAGLGGFDLLAVALQHTADDHLGRCLATLVAGAEADQMVGATVHHVYLLDHDVRRRMVAPDFLIEQIHD